MSSRTYYEPSTSGWHRVRRSAARRRIVGWSMGGVAVLLVGALATFLLLVSPAWALR
jgi:hypothetical protein